MELTRDLRAEVLSAALPGRRIVSYPAVLSTQSAALALARSGAEEGVIVVADYQAAARGRAGVEWRVQSGQSLGFSLVLRPDLTPDREGWLYTVGALGVADALGEGAEIEWPDEVRRRAVHAALAVDVGLAPARVDWAVLSVVVPKPPSSRIDLLAKTVMAVEGRCRAEPPGVLEDYAARCSTPGRQVRARLIPLGPAGPEVSGKAVGSLEDGSLVIETSDGKRIAVRPQSLGLLEDARGETD